MASASGTMAGTPVSAFPPPLHHHHRRPTISNLFSSPPRHHPRLSPLRTTTTLLHERRRRRSKSLVLNPRVIPHLPRCSHHEGAGADGVGEEEISRATLLWRAVKLPIYSVALVPLTVGSCAAYFETGLFFTKRYLVLLAASVLIITWLNLSNDVYDFDTGADKNKKESIVNLGGSRSVTYAAANASLAIGFMGLIWASGQSGDIRTILLLTFAILCGYVYQCPPFRLSYKGLGEPLCFAAFGPFATTAFYFSQGGKILSSEMFQLPITGTVLSASLFVGLTTTLILFCSHFHQIDGDQAVGKMSPLVRIGTQTGSIVVKIAIVALYSLLLAFGFARVLPITCMILCALTLPMGKLVLNFVEENYNDMVKIFMAKYYCVRMIGKQAHCKQFFANACWWHYQRQAGDISIEGSNTSSVILDE